jgi:hypothetical protein
MIQEIIAAFIPVVVAGLISLVIWVRELKTNHLPHIEAAVNAIPEALQKQTTAIISELKEQRADIRLLTSTIAGKL